MAFSLLFDNQFSGYRSHQDYEGGKGAPGSQRVYESWETWQQTDYAQKGAWITTY